MVLLEQFGILRAYLGTSEVIVTIMMNYIILYSTNALVRDGISDTVMRTSDASQVSTSASYQMGWLSALTNNSRMNLGMLPCNNCSCSCLVYY